MTFESEVALGAPDRAIKPCFMHEMYTRLCQIDVIMTNNYQVTKKIKIQNP